MTPSPIPPLIPLLTAFFLTLFLTLGTAAPSLAEGSPKKGRRIAVDHCSRCHVIPDHNPGGGIGSTLSFKGLVRLSDYRERLATFYDRRPHASFVRVEGVERWTKFPANAAEIRLTLEDVDHVVAYGDQLRAKGD